MKIGSVFLFFCDFPIIRGEKELPLYLLHMGQHHCQNHIIRNGGYPCNQILYCTKGSGTLITNGEKIPIPACTAIFMPADCPHEYYPNEDIWDIHWVVPAGFAHEDILRHFGLTEAKVFALKEMNALEHIFRKMHEALRSDSVYGNYRASGYLYDFLMEFYRLISVKGTSASPNPALIRAVDYIDFNYARHISMDQLCAASGVTKQHLCMLFRTTFGLRPTEHITKRRIQAAKELLAGTGKSTEEIALETGFCTSSYFCKMFRRYEGITPSEFRKN